MNNHSPILHKWWVNCNVLPSLVFALSSKVFLTRLCCIMSFCFIHIIFNKTDYSSQQARVFYSAGFIQKNVLRISIKAELEEIWGISISGQVIAQAAYSFTFFFCSSEADSHLQILICPGPILLHSQSKCTEVKTCTFVTFHLTATLFCLD